MSSKEPTNAQHARASQLASRLIEVIAATADDLGRMPFFVRPMVKRGVAKRTGKSLEEWRDLALAIHREIMTSPDVGDCDALLGRRPTLRADLERLADDYHTAPDRAARAMRGDALARVRERSVERERIVRELIEALTEVGLR
ncbi:hypothetical protein [Haliangium sp.]|uniref:hypothetical protein n=1 Tax=Haliangium sp. TaxID=2663208 RepID=UPI003D0CF493